MRFFLALIAAMAPAAAWAADTVSLSSEVFVERVKQEAGQSRVVQEPPTVVTPGDKLVFILSYRNDGAAPASGFVVTNPLPEAVSFTGEETAGAVVSVDGGKSWGQLARLKVPGADGQPRAATPGDVTHIRWAFAQPIGAGTAGKLSFRGVVK
jgi:uncharacterized repeat protein (TIGR01451 family)